MTQTSLTQRQQEQVRRLARLGADLAAGLEANRQRLQDALAGAEEQCAALTDNLSRQSSEALSQLEDEYNRQLEAARVRLEGVVETLEQKRAEKSDQLSQQRAMAIAAAIEDFETTDLRLRDRRVHDADQLKKRHEQFVLRCRAYLEQLEQLRQQARNLLGRRGLELPAGDGAPAGEDDKAWSSTLIRDYDRHVEQLNALLHQMQRSTANRFLDEGWSILLLLAALLLGAWPWGIVTGYAPLPWIAAVLSSSLLATFLAYQLAHRATVRQFRAGTPELADQLATAEVSVRHAVRASERETKAGREELRRQLASGVRESTRRRRNFSGSRPN
jgi:hypothetical protein